MMLGRLTLNESYRLDVPDDERGIDVKVGLIAAQIRQSRETPEVKALAVQLTEGVYTDRDKVQAVYTYTQKHFDYRPDVEATDVFVAPHRQIDRMMKHGFGWGDCDDYVIFMGALLHNIGVKIRPVVVATTSSSTGDYNHIYLEAWDRYNMRWITMDAVRQGRPLGKTTAATKSLVYDTI